MYKFRPEHKVTKLLIISGMFPPPVKAARKDWNKQKWGSKQENFKDHDSRYQQEMGVSTELKWGLRYMDQSSMFHSLWEEECVPGDDATGVTSYFFGYYFPINMNSPLQDSGSFTRLSSNGYFSCFSGKVNDGTIGFWSISSPPVIPLLLWIAFNHDIPLCWHSPFKQKFWKRKVFNFFYDARQVFQQMLVLWRLTSSSLHLLATFRHKK